MTHDHHNKEPMTIVTPQPQPRPRDRAARPIGGVAPSVVVVVVVAMVVSAVGAWLVLQGRGADRPRASGSQGVADAHGGARADRAEVARRGAPAPQRSVGDRGGPDPVAGDDGEGHDGRGAERMLAFFDEYERQIDAATARARESVVALEYTGGRSASGRRRIASGVAINARGDILSVRIDPPRGGAAAKGSELGKAGRDPAPAPIVARDYLGRRHVARWIAADPHTGLTLLRISPRAIRPIRPATDGPKLGSQVFVLGNPFGLGHSVHPGHVAGLDRVLELGARQLGGLIQVQATLYPGDGGAAVVDIHGGLLGLIRGGLAIRGAPTEPVGPAAEARGDAEADEYDGEPDTEFGFAIPTLNALWIAEQLRAHGRVDRAYLGVGLVETMPVAEGPTPTPESTPAEAWRGASGPPDAAPPLPTDPDPAPVPGDGARVREVIDDTPAARAGLRPGDRIVAIDGQSIRSRNDLIDRLDRIPARKAIVLTVARDGDPDRSRFQVALRTASRPGQAAPAPTSTPPRSEGASVPVTPTASRAGPSTKPQDPPVPTPERPTGSLNELKLTLPRAVVERIEHLERRIDELEHLRTVAKPGAGAAGDPDPSPRPRLNAPGPAGDRNDRAPGPR